MKRNFYVKTRYLKTQQYKIDCIVIQFITYFVKNENIPSDKRKNSRNVNILHVWLYAYNAYNIITYLRII